MQFKKTILRAAVNLYSSQPIRGFVVVVTILLFCHSGFGQTTFVPQGDKQNVLLDRLEIKALNDSVLNFSKTRPFSRKHAVNGTRSYVDKFGKESLSRVDAYNVERLYLNNLEYLTAEEREAYKSKKPILKN